jgi:cytochrome c-type biogenesis protein CcmH/NrfG
LRTGDRLGAQRAFDTARRLDPENPLVKAHVALSGEDLWQVRKMLSELASQWGGSAEIWQMTGKISESLGEWSEAAEAYQSALAKKPYALNAHLGLISAGQELGQPARASAALDQAFRINPHHPKVLAWRTKRRPR